MEGKGQGQPDRRAKVAGKGKGAKRLPSWGRGLHDEPLPEHKAQEEDRRTRAAYGVALRAPYLSITQIPDVVGPGDYVEARAILSRITRALEHGEGGVWTPSERNRLRGQHKAWARRASGKDTLFNLVGWRRKPLTYGRERDRWEDARKFAASVQPIRDVIDAAMPGSLYGELVAQDRKRKRKG